MNDGSRLCRLLRAFRCRVALLTATFFTRQRSSPRAERGVAWSVGKVSGLLAGFGLFSLPLCMNTFYSCARAGFERKQQRKQGRRDDSDDEDRTSGGDPTHKRQLQQRQKKRRRGDGDEKNTAFPGEGGTRIGLEWPNSPAIAHRGVCPVRSRCSLVVEYFRQRGLRVEGIPPDGNCMFAAIADQLKVHGIRADADHSILRREFYQIARTHWQDWSHFFDNDEQQLGRMRRSGVWDTAVGDGVIPLLQNQYRVHVRIYRRQENVGVIFADHLYPHANAGERIETMELYRSGAHYDSVRPGTCAVWGPVCVCGAWLV